MGWVTSEVVGPDGTWVGTAGMSEDPSRAELPSWGVAEGTGAYEGWTYWYHIPDLLAPDSPDYGILYEGPPPPWGTTLPLSPAEYPTIAPPRLPAALASVCHRHAQEAHLAHPHVVGVLRGHRAHPVHERLAGEALALGRVTRCRATSGGDGPTRGRRRRAPRRSPPSPRPRSLRAAPPLRPVPARGRTSSRRGSARGSSGVGCRGSSRGPRRGGTTRRWRPSARPARR